MIQVDLLLLDGASAGSVGATVDTIAAANRITGEESFQLRFIGVPARVTLRGGLEAHTTPLDAAEPRDLVVVPGLGAATGAEVAARLAESDAIRTIEWLRAAATGHTEIAASCTAVFLVAAAGLLHQRRCVTTWWLGTELAELAPGCHVDVDEMVVRDGRIWTAGSAFAHIDLVLALMRHFGGAELTDELAHRLILDERTSQASFLVPAHLAGNDDVVAELERFIRANLTEQHTLASLARHSHLSARTLDRRTRRAVDMSPLQLVQRVRLGRAVHLLRTTTMSLDEIAAAIGLNDANTLHRLVKRHTGKPPGRLRR
ncbi:GlxA family transcriptional regulator [Nocardioides limicola]|uniref:GlxA family transcriptional regulator n=1 Tax=Nocardioides limicola TaxID=2803368 RepID=UPI00193C8418|nr:helix-turn-helix domain-containing protein [Nocardioides sp. DJM-14]